MSTPIFETKTYKEMMHRHIYDAINLFFQENREFGIACEVSHIQFNPELPQTIKETFQEVVLFIIGGYSFESAKLEEGFFIFEAGFGQENFGSVVEIPLLGIKQIIVEDTPIIINLSLPDKEEKKESELSMQALLNHPENKKLLKKRKH